jgi:multidrug transporter EmrE-like cation transporter
VGRGQTKIEGKHLLAGLILGIPNYFSIFLLMLSYSTTGWQDSTVLAVTNVSVVVASALLGFVAFRETSSPKKLIGLLAAISAILTLYYASLNVEL